MKTNIILLILFLTFALSCTQGNQSSKLNGDLKPAVSAQGLTPAKEQLTVTPETDLYSDGKANLVKKVNYRFQVESVKKSTEAIEAATKKYPAYISSSNLRLENPILENKMSIRVQSEYFQELLKEIDQQAVFVNFRNVDVEDVSKEFVDLESRIKTKREVEERYMEILRKKAGTIKELLEAEGQIGALHEEIEATIGRLNFLKDQVHYSSINLEFYQTITQESLASHEETLPGKFSSAFAAGLHGVINITVALTYIWPVIVLGMGAVLAYRIRKTNKIPGS